MYDFKKHLLENEEILYEGRAFPGKGGKEIIGLLFVICFSLFVLALLIWSVVTGTGDGANGVTIEFIIIFLVFLLFLGIGLYGLVYNLFLKKIQVADDYYCLTNIRAMKYESKKDKLVYGYLKKYEEIYCENVKGGYGDLYMVSAIDEKYLNDHNMSVLDYLLSKSDPEDMPSMCFESIKNPRQLRKMAIDARRKIIDNENK